MHRTYNINQFSWSPSRFRIMRTCISIACCCCAMVRTSPVFKACWLARLDEVSSSLRFSDTLRWNLNLYVSS